MIMTDIYKPSGCVSLAEQEYSNAIRLGIQSPPGLGKTFAALTFPNPVPLDFNKGLGAHVGRPDVIPVPFWDGKFCDSIHKRNGTQCPPNQKDALTDWLLKEGIKLKPWQTCIFDSNTEIEAAFHIQYATDGGPPIGKSGVADSYDEYKKKLAWYSYLTALIKSLPCMVVYITHETVEWDKQGDATGGAKPLLSGQAGDKIVGDYTDWFRQWAIAKPVSLEAQKKMREKYQLDDTAFNEWMASTPANHQTIYLWQNQSDEMFKLKTSNLVNAPKFVLANYSSFLKYKRTKES
jgi:hypothetical protein